MGKRGPRPKPTAMKKVQGTFRPDRAPGNEPKPKPKIPSAPNWLGTDGRREWRRVTKELAAIDMLTELDRTTLALYCQALQEYLDAKRALEAENEHILVARERRRERERAERKAKREQSPEHVALAQLAKETGTALPEEPEEPEFPHNGQTAISSKGTLIIHPLVSIRNEAWKRVLKAAAEFGMSPSARTRIDLPLGAGIPEPENEFAAFAARRRA